MTFHATTMKNNHNDNSYEIALSEHTWNGLVASLPVSSFHYVSDISRWPIFHPFKTVKHYVDFMAKSQPTQHTLVHSSIMLPLPASCSDGMKPNYLISRVWGVVCLSCLCECECVRVCEFQETGTHERKQVNKIHFNYSTLCSFAREVLRRALQSLQVSPFLAFC